jgi:putative salt-induced outer membrane protein YdiY
MKIQNLLGPALLVLSLGSVFSLRQAWSDDSGFHDESEVGMVITTGNTRANTFNFKQKNTYGWGVTHLLKFEGAFLDTNSFGTESARSYSLGLRFEEKLTERFSLFIGQDLESDIFAGYLQRFNSDLGSKYQVFKEDGFSWNVEGGYRYTIENRLAGDQTLKSFLRAYSDVAKDINKNVTTKLSVEYLPNLSSFSDFRINSELSLAALLNDVFSIKTGYLVKYINQPLPGVAVTTDTIFTTALVAKL